VSTRDILMLAAPLLPMSMLAMTLHGRWCAQIFAPPQFAALVGEAMLAFVAHRTLTQAGGAVGLVLAMAGLLAVVLYEHWIPHRAAALVRWNDFERDFRAYAESHVKR
jgi:hypothetical protein